MGATRRAIRHPSTDQLLPTFQPPRVPGQPPSCPPTRSPPPPPRARDGRSRRPFRHQRTAPPAVLPQRIGNSESSVSLVPTLVGASSSLSPNAISVLRGLYYLLECPSNHPPSWNILWREGNCYSHYWERMLFLPNFCATWYWVLELLVRHVRAIECRLRLYGRVYGGQLLLTIAFMQPSW